MTHTLTYNGGLRDTLASTGKAAEAGEQKGAVSESLKALNRKSHVLETDVEHSKSVISEIVTQVPYIGPEPPTDPETGRLWQDEADPPGAAGMERQRVDNGGGQDHGDFLRRAADEGRHHHGFPQRQGRQLHGVYRRRSGHLRQPQGHRGAPRRCSATTRWSRC